MPNIGFWAVAGSGGGAAGAYELISTTTLTGTSASIVFSSLTQSYKHLHLRITMRGDVAATQTPFYLRLNSDSGTNYSRHWLRSDGSSTLSANAGNGESAIWQNYTLGASSTSSAFTSAIIDILDYSSNNKNTTVRTVIGSHGGSGGHTAVSLSSGGWYNTAAVTNLNMYLASGNFIAGSRFSLYGVKA